MTYNPFDRTVQDDELQVFRKLIQHETEFMASEGYHQNDKIASFRQFAVSYIEEVKFGFRFCFLVSSSRFCY